MTRALSRVGNRGELAVTAALGVSISSPPVRLSRKGEALSRPDAAPAHARGANPGGRVAVPSYRRESP
jgi:hypothetical protein